MLVVEATDQKYKMRIHLDPVALASFTKYARQLYVRPAALLNIEIRMLKELYSIKRTAPKCGQSTPNSESRTFRTYSVLPLRAPEDVMQECLNGYQQGETVIRGGSDKAFGALCGGE